MFYINLPFGVLAFLGLMFFMPKAGARDRSARFDWLGFGVLALGIGALQFMLDRGELKDWFSSTEILIEATLGGARPLSLPRAHGAGGEALHPAAHLQ